MNGANDQEAGAATTLPADFGPKATRNIGNLCLVVGIVGALSALATLYQAGFRAAALGVNPALRTHALWVNGVGVPLAAVLAVAGFGLRQRREWARRTLMVYAGIAMLSTVIFTALRLAMLKSGLPDGQALEGAALFGVLVFPVVSLVLHLALLGIARHPEVRKTCS